MGAATKRSRKTRKPLSRDRILRAAVAVADSEGAEALSMRRIATELAVEAMSLYNHVRDKEDLLDGVADEVVAEISLDGDAGAWKEALRARALAARAVMLRHPWASKVILSRTALTPVMLGYMDSAIGIMVRGGFSIGLAHNAMHTLGSRLLGFTQEMIDTQDLGPEIEGLAQGRIPAERYPFVSRMLFGVTHDPATTVGRGCDDQAEFEFGLDLILDGLERARLRSGGSRPARERTRRAARDV